VEKDKFKNNKKRRLLEFTAKLLCLLNEKGMPSFFLHATQELLKNRFRSVEDAAQTLSLFYLQHRYEILPYLENHPIGKGDLDLISFFPEIQAIPESEVKKFWSQEYEERDGEWSRLHAQKKQNMAVFIRIDLLMQREEIPIPLRIKFRDFVNSETGKLPTKADEMLSDLDHAPSEVAARFYLKHREEILSYLKS
jgi:hypothetical protein